MKFKKIAFLALTTLALAACGGGTTTIDTPPAIDAAPHIKATVAGAAFNALNEVYGDSMPPDAATKWLDIFGYVYQSGNMVGKWAIDGIPNAKGRHPCKRGVGDDRSTEIRLGDYRDEGNKNYYADGMNGSECFITVEQVSPTEVSGFFTATLLEDTRVVRVTEGGRIASPATVKVTQGSFRVPLDGGPR